MSSEFGVAWMSDCSLPREKVGEWKAGDRAIEGELPRRSHVRLRERLPVRDAASDAELVSTSHDRQVVADAVGRRLVDGFALGPATDLKATVRSR